MIVKNKDNLWFQNMHRAYKRIFICFNIKYIINRLGIVSGRSSCKVEQGLVNLL